ncbi:TetR/AcrR family transcriptional regulator [Phenylobacterium sp. J367]|uniref:TetR/AcrR family transcriptional regulator n=1 Tax=Phenylobacterium sp. J367 TaxID=2898435 RepID=UPI0021519D02|nr:TetR/AcrR family transcriptional regulator [Phenylobacterium sp. J367]MCR5879837.1 TetR family transcriptional regulator [Phenylobacterium sp. J367]
MKHEAAEPRAPARQAKEKTRTNDPDRTKANILEVATHEFSEKGLSGARIDEIAERTRTSKRMIYYYFESKEGLYRAVLEDSYRRIRNIESTLDLESKPPLEALAQHVRFTFDHQLANTDFIRLVMVENIHHGEHIAQLSKTQQESMGAIDTLRGIVERGIKDGVMRKDLDPIDLHMSISALCFFNVANRHTFSTIFKVDMESPAATAARRESVTEMILRFVAA